MSKRFRAAVIAAVVAGLLLVPAVATSRPVVIKAKSGPLRFTPNFPHVVKGQKVKWKNTTSSSHTLSFYKGRWSGKTFSLPANGSFAKKPKRRGTYYYRCSVPGHSTLVDDNCNGMCGKFHVGN